MTPDEKVLWKVLWEIASGPSKYDFGVEGLLDRVYPTRTVVFKIKTRKGEEEVEFEICSISRGGRTDPGSSPGVEGHWWYFRGYVQGSNLEPNPAPHFWNEVGSRTHEMVGTYSTKRRKGFIRPIRTEEYEMIRQMQRFPRLPGDEE